MVQLQFLSFGLSAPPTIQELRQGGYLDDIYGQAFDSFLKAARLEEPMLIHDPRVALFLLIVDLAINPTRGFPLDIEDFANFINDTDPGIRFLRFCQAARDRPESAAAITDYSKTEYEAVSGILCDACDYDRPLMALQEVASWPSRTPGVARVMAERESFAFDLSNVVVRVLLYHFIGVSTDKLRTRNSSAGQARGWRASGPARSPSRSSCAISRCTPTRPMMTASSRVNVLG